MRSRRPTSRGRGRLIPASWARSSSLRVQEPPWLSAMGLHRCACACPLSSACACSDRSPGAFRSLVGRRGSGLTKLVCERKHTLAVQPEDCHASASPARVPAQLDVSDCPVRPAITLTNPALLVGDCTPGGTRAAHAASAPCARRRRQAQFAVCGHPGPPVTAASGGLAGAAAYRL